jgi:hypothetical protein
MWKRVKQISDERVHDLRFRFGGKAWKSSPRLTRHFSLSFSFFTLQHNTHSLLQTTTSVVLAFFLCLILWFFYYRMNRLPVLLMRRLSSNFYGWAQCYFDLLWGVQWGCYTCRWFWERYDGLWLLACRIFSEVAPAVGCDTGCFRF